MRHSRTSLHGEEPLSRRLARTVCRIYSLHQSKMLAHEHTAPIFSGNVIAAMCNRDVSCLNPALAILLITCSHAQSSAGANAVGPKVRLPTNNCTYVRVLKVLSRILDFCSECIDQRLAMSAVWPFCQYFRQRPLYLHKLNQCGIPSCVVCATL